MASQSIGRLTNVEALKQAIYDSVNIVTIAERLGMELQASGEQWRGLCPLHVENTPSWYANPNKGPGGVYHCFGCQQNGDMIDLVEKVRHLNFIEALYWLANEADVDISAYERPLSEEEKRQEELHNWAEGWLSVWADGSEHAGRTLARVPVETAIQFGVCVRYGIGTAPSYFTQENDYLGDGVIFPWRTPSGRLVGWRVREHPGQEKKVIGTPNDFPLGKVREQTLFGIQVAREHIIEGRLYLVEGEYDCLALHAHGIKNVVAMGGNSLTEGQMQLLESLHVREIVVVLDGDEGGHKGAHALASKYWAHDVFVRVTTCNEGTDPEDVVREGGEFFFEMIVSSARVALEWLLRQEWARKGRETLTDKMEFVKWVRDTYGQKLRSTDESLVLVEVARWLEIPEVEVRDYVRAADGSLCAVDSERMLLGRCLRDQQYYVHLRGRLVRDDFFVLKHQRVWDMMADMLIDGLDTDLVTAEERAGRHGVPEGYVGGLIESPESNLDHHIGVVADLSLRRSARDDAMAFRDRIQDLGQPADNLVGDLTHRLITKALSKSGTTSKQLSDHVDQAMDELHERMDNPSEIHGLDLGTQQPRLSRVLQGLQGGRLYLVSAISRIGKTTLLAQWAASIGVHQSIPIDFISLEMDESELLFKIASHMTGIDSTFITGGRLDPGQAGLVERAMLRIRNSPLHIWAPDGLTSSEFLLYARESVMQRRTQAFFVDYIQLIDPETGQERDNGYKLYGDFARLAKMKVARSLEVAVVAAAQLGRQAADTDRPTAEMMGDSYAMVRHSNVVLILHGKEDQPTLDLYVDKNRGGAGGGTIPYIYDRPAQTMREAEGGLAKPEYTIA